MMDGLEVCIFESFQRRKSQTCLDIAKTNASPAVDTKIELLACLDTVGSRFSDTKTTVPSQMVTII
jgi:hypothetical protein